MLRTTCIAVLSMCFAAGAHAADPKLLREAIDMAAEICGEYERSGDKSEFQLSGAAEAKVKGLFRNFVDAGGEVSGSRSGEAYSNVVREELSKELLSTRDCRQDMSKFLIDKLSANTQNVTGSGGGVRQVAAQLDLTGNWQFQGTCPNPAGFGTVPVSGAFQMQRVGANSYQGSIYNNFGYSGTLQTEASGNFARSRIIWSDYSVGQANGTLSADGRVMDIQDTAGCFTRAFKTN